MKVKIISGAKNSSKTTTLKSILEKSNEKYLGYICESDNEKNNYYLRNIYSNELFHIMQNEFIETKERIGQYYIIDNSFEKCSTVLFNQINEIEDQIDFIALDEVGLLELNGSGYNQTILKLIDLNYDLILCVRDVFVERVIEKYKFENVEIIRV
ncbi:MAG: nucleoside-triphosphatase [Pleomorphochaeta sp.]